MEYFSNRRARVDAYYRAQVTLAAHSRDDRAACADRRTAEHLRTATKSFRRAHAALTKKKKKIKH